MKYDIVVAGAGSAGVYDIFLEEDTAQRLQINAQTCVHYDTSISKIPPNISLGWFRKAGMGRVIRIYAKASSDKP